MNAWQSVVMNLDQSQSSIYFNQSESFIYFNQSQSSMKMAKFYAIARGRVPGLYLDWTEAKKQVEGFSNAKFKSFKTKDDAKAFLAQYSDVVLPPEPKRTCIKNHGQEYNQFASEAAMYDRVAYLLQFDGGARGNPGHSGAGAVLFNFSTRQVVWSGYEYVGSDKTNNQAEYGGLILGLKAALKLKITDLVIEGDSDLIVQQITGNYKADKLQSLYSRVMHLLPYFDYVINHIPRARNSIADRLANLAMDRKANGEAFGRLVE